MFRLYKYYLLLACAVLIFTTCKKFPENTLWFKRPAAVLERGRSAPWILDYYSVNDNDSTNSNAIRVYKNLGVVIGDNESPYGFYCEGIIQGGYTFKNKKKTIQFFYGDFNFHTNSISNANYINQKNIFLDDELHWKILKLCKKSFWINATFNNIKYEMHFK